MSGGDGGQHLVVQARGVAALRPSQYLAGGGGFIIHENHLEKSE